MRSQSGMHPMLSPLALHLSLLNVPAELLC
jgi:hypothetical protein